MYEHGRPIRFEAPCSYTVYHVWAWQSITWIFQICSNLVRLRSMAGKYALNIAICPNLVRLRSMASKYALNIAICPNLVRLRSMAVICCELFSLHVWLWIYIKLIWSLQQGFGPAVAVLNLSVVSQRSAMPPKGSKSWRPSRCPACSQD